MKHDDGVVFDWHYPPLLQAAKTLPFVSHLALKLNIETQQHINSLGSVVSWIGFDQSRAGCGPEHGEIGCIFKLDMNSAECVDQLVTVHQHDTNNCLIPWKITTKLYIQDVGLVESWLTKMSLVDQRNWEDYNHAFNQTFQALDQDLTDPNRFPKGRKYFMMFPILKYFSVIRQKRRQWLLVHLSSPHSLWLLPVLRWPQLLMAVQTDSGGRHGEV